MKLEKPTVFFLILLSIVALMNPISASTQEPSHVEMKIVHQPNGSAVNLENFPQVTIDFEITDSDNFIPSIDENTIQLFEDDTSISIPQGQIKSESHPLSIVFVLDVGPEQMDIDLPMLQELVRFFNNQALDEDAWHFCSTKLEGVCTQTQGSIRDQSLDIQLDTVFRQLSQSAAEVEYVELVTVIQNVLTLNELNSPQQKLLLLIKQNPDSYIPYIPDPLLAELEQRRIPVFLVDLNGEQPVFANDMIIRLQRLSGFYYSRNGNNRWNSRQGLVAGLGKIRPVMFRVTYTSQLFPDEDVHQISLGYQTDNIEVWDHKDFEFQFLGREPQSSLKPLARTANSYFLLIMTVLLLSILVISENDKQCISENDEQGIS